MSDHDELELAIAGMHERFLSIGERIGGLLAALGRQLDAIPVHARGSIDHAARQIAGTQQRLRAQMARLPTRPEDRYRIMQSLLQAQEGALQQLTIIVEQHLPQASGRPAPMPRNVGQAVHSQVPAKPRKLRPNRTRRERLDGGSNVFLEMVASRRLAVTAALLAVAGLGYWYLPAISALMRDRPGKILAAKEATAPKFVPPKEEALPVEEPSFGARKLVPQVPGIVLTQPLPPKTEPAGPEKLPAKPPVIVQATPPVETPATAPAKPPAADTTITGSIEPVKPRFVAVVFTHQDAEETLAVFADLQKRYPNLLGRRKAEAQPIEIADKGTWHRLVVLPAGPRQTAVGLCDQLQAAGYDRCWVKAY